MTEHEYHFLLGERHTLQRLIEETPAENVIDLLSLRSRLADVEGQIAAAEAAPIVRDPARAHLTFSGAPVVDQHGILADFGTKAVSIFAEAIAAVAAALTGPLAAMGPIPHREQNRLLITNVALGSFGFELEEYRPEPSDGPTSVEIALERATDLLQGSIEVGDEQLADAASDLGNRAIGSVRSFVELLVENQATCALAVRDKTFRFNDLDQVRRSLARLGNENVHENEQELDVVFLGALPTRRTFEFRLHGSAEVLSGRCGPAVSALDALNDNRHRVVRARFMVSQVGEGKPRYKLLQMPNWPAGPGR